MPECAGDKSEIYVYSTRHQDKTHDDVVKTIKNHGYQIKSRTKRDGSIKLEFGNNNEISITSLKTSSIIELEEKLKTGTQTEGEQNVKFIWFEEFTAILSEFRDINTFMSAKSRLLRRLKSDGVIIYTYNPPANISHMIYD